MTHHHALLWTVAVKQSTGRRDRDFRLCHAQDCHPIPALPQHLRAPVYIICIATSGAVSTSLAAGTQQLVHRRRYQPLTPIQPFNPDDNPTKVTKRADLSSTPQRNQLQEVQN